MGLKILIVKTSAIGDVIHTLPVVDYLLQRFPDAQIDWVVEKSCFDFLSAYSGLRRVLKVDVKRWRKELLRKAIRNELKGFLKELKSEEYDLLFDFQGNTKSALITFMAKAKVKVGFGWKTLAEKPNYFVTDWRCDIPRSAEVRSRYLGLVKAYFKDESPVCLKPSTFHLQEKELKQLEELLTHPLMSQKPRLMIAFGSNWKNKKLSDESLIAFLKHIESKYHPSFFFPWGNKEEADMAEKLQSLFPENSLVIGKLPLPLWHAFMAQLDGVISMDSAALHLASTTTTPTFSFFGPSLSTVFQPAGEKHGSFQGICPYGRSFIERCPVLRSCKTGACLREANLESLVSQFDQWWLARPSQ